MNKKIKAALTSALVFPGTGQFLLQRKRQGSAYAIVAAFGLFAFIVELYNRATGIIEHMKANRIAADPDLIRKLLEAPPFSHSDLLLNGGHAVSRKVQQNVGGVVRSGADVDGGVPLFEDEADGCAEVLAQVAAGQPCSAALCFRVGFHDDASSAAG